MPQFMRALLFKSVKGHLCGPEDQANPPKFQCALLGEGTVSLRAANHKARGGDLSCLATLYAMTFAVGAGVET
eukprot:6880756-Alexandrium_andersonii.AAC.1